MGDVLRPGDPRALAECRCGLSRANLPRPPVGVELGDARPPVAVEAHSGASEARASAAYSKRLAGRVASPTWTRASVRPIIFCVGDSAGAVQQLRSELRRRYQADYEVLGYRTPRRALARLERARSEMADVALALADHRLPGMTGLELLARARRLHPSVRRVLLVDLGDSNAAEPIVRAMTLGQLDGYMIKPWGNPEDRLYPTVGELLRDWTLDNRPRFEVVHIVAPPASARAHELRDLLERNGIPAALHGDESAEGRRILGEAADESIRRGVAAGAPVAVLFDGRVFVDPSNSELAAALGARRRPQSQDHDVAVVGAGPAGIGAAVYASSEGLETVLLEQEAIGGQAGTSSRIRNYLGFPRGLSGAELAGRAFEQAWLFGTDVLISAQVVELRPARSRHQLVLADGSTLLSRADPGPWRWAREHHVRLPRRRDRSRTQHRGAQQMPGRGGRRWHAAGVDHRRGRQDRTAADAARRRPVRDDRRASPQRLARGRPRPRR